MSFEVVAASRIEERQIAPWRHALHDRRAVRIARLFITVVGIFGMFNNRPIIVGELTLGYATLWQCFLLAGF